jgi:hypothetical protein
MQLTAAGSMSRPAIARLTGRGAIDKEKRGAPDRHAASHIFSKEARGSRR